MAMLVMKPTAQMRIAQVGMRFRRSLSPMTGAGGVRDFLS
jgi:hypothetical protein